jgi:hypothetical protein
MRWFRRRRHASGAAVEEAAAGPTTHAEISTPEVEDGIPADPDAVRTGPVGIDVAEIAPTEPPPPLDRPAEAGGAEPESPPIGIDELWRRLQIHEGETFRQIRGKEFTYSLGRDGLVPSTTDWVIPKSHFEQALALVPLRNTVPVQHLFGPSYIYAVLMDERIRGAEW